MNRYVRGVAAGLLLALGTAARGDVVDVPARRDVTLFEDSLGLIANGAGQFLFVGETNSGSTRRGLLYFEVENYVPAGSTIDSAVLTLHCSRSSSTGRRIDVHRALATWGEGASNSGDPGGGGANPEPGDATWLHRFYSPTSPVFWNTPGGEFEATILASQTVSGVGNYSWQSAGLTAGVQAWLNDPAQNFGWLVQGVESGRSAKRFDTHENATPAFRPVLRVNYTIPEPATGLLVGAAALLGLRRRGA